MAATSHSDNLCKGTTVCTPDLEQLCQSAVHVVQKTDLARMYRLFQRIPKGLEPVAESFRKHVESEGMKLVKEATEAATAKKDKDAGKPSKDTGVFRESAELGHCCTAGPLHYTDTTARCS